MASYNLYVYLGIFNYNLDLSPTLEFQWQIKV